METAAARNPQIAALLVDALLRARPRIARTGDDIRKYDAARPILNADPRLQIAVLRDIVDRIGQTRERLGDPQRHDPRYMNLHHDNKFPVAGMEIVGLLLRRKLPFDVADVIFLVDRTAHLEQTSTFCIWYLPALVTLVEAQKTSGPLPADLLGALQRLRSSLEHISNAAETKLRVRISDLLLTVPVYNPIKPGESWSDVAIAEIGEVGSWITLVDHCRTATTASPSAKWLAKAEELLKGITADAFGETLCKWLPLIAKPRTQPPASRSWRDATTDWILEETNSDILRGLCWVSTLSTHKELPRALAGLVATSLKKLPGIGPRYPKLANGGIYALGASRDANALAQLARLKISVKFGTAQKAIEKAMNAAAQRLGVSRNDLDELAIPTYGFSAQGTLTTLFGQARGMQQLTATSVQLCWFNAAGKSVKALSPEIRNAYASDIKEFKAVAADVEKMISAQKSRLDNLMISAKTWKLKDFKERYLEHPILAIVARRLLWTIDGVPALFREDAPEDIEGNSITHGQTAEIALWHPVNRPVAEVIAWRKRLSELQISQPFKQIYRELYLLTDAERRTHTYSNRYAAHIIRQHQFGALCGARCWKNKLRLLVDGEFPPASKEMPEYGLRAEFWIEGAGDNHGSDTNDAGVFYRLATDQVRFYRMGAAENSTHAFGGRYRAITGAPGERNINEPVALEQIPALVFSEIMRDVDLFVGVASVGNDPTWQDGGPDGRYQAYWQNYSFGDLGETAKTRKVVLETLLPRLKIAGQCSLVEKFLRVQGKLRAYKIHLGSGNILMEPNDQYLCIVASQSGKGGGDLYLPFEGDSTLAVILSKAFLLAGDDKIKDETITRQIRPG